MNKRGHYIETKKYNKVISKVNNEFPDNIRVHDFVINGLRQDALDKKAIYTDNYLMKVDNLAEKLLNTYVANDLDKSNDIDKETVSRIKFFNKLDKEMA